MHDKLEVPKYKLLDVSKVQTADYNPATRLNRNRLKQLTDSMSRIGLVYPILVDGQYRVIDGHRRLAAACELGWRSIAAIIFEGGDRDIVYGEVNSTASKMNGCETLGVWLANRKAVPPKMDKLFAEMVTVLGRPLVKAMHERGLSARAYQTANRVARYCGCESKEYVKQVVVWLKDTALVGQVMKALECGTPPKRIAAAVRTNKPLLLTQGDSDSEPNAEAN